MMATESSWLGWVRPVSPGGGGYEVEGQGANGGNDVHPVDETSGVWGTRRVDVKPQACAEEIRE